MRHLRHIGLAATVVGLSLTFAAPLASAQDSNGAVPGMLASTGTSPAT